MQRNYCALVLLASACMPAHVHAMAGGLRRGAGQAAKAAGEFLAKESGALKQEAEVLGKQAEVFGKQAEVLGEEAVIAGRQAQMAARGAQVGAAGRGVAVRGGAQVSRPMFEGLGQSTVARQAAETQRGLMQGMGGQTRGMATEARTGSKGLAEIIGEKQEKKPDVVERGVKKSKWDNWRDLSLKERDDIFYALSWDEQFENLRERIDALGRIDPELLLGRYGDIRDRLKDFKEEGSRLSSLNNEVESYEEYPGVKIALNNPLGTRAKMNQKIAEIDQQIANLNEDINFLKDTDLERELRMRLKRFDENVRSSLSNTMQKFYSGALPGMIESVEQLDEFVKSVPEILKEKQAKKEKKAQNTGTSWFKW